MKKQGIILPALIATLAGCAITPMTQEEQDSSSRTIRALEILKAHVDSRSGSPPPFPASPAAVSPSITAFLKSQYVSGQNRICIYDRAGSQFVTTVAVWQLCQITQ